MSVTDLPTVPNEACAHKIANHMHGTRACYTLDSCRCDDCQEARLRYDRRRKKWLGAFPQLPAPMVDAAPVRVHLESLMGEGMGPKRIAEVSRVPHGAISKLLYGDYKGRPPSKTITRRNAEILLGLELDLADGARIPKIEAVLIVDELLARGWTKTGLSGRFGSYPGNLLRGPTTTAGTLRALRRLLLEPVPLRKHGPTGKLYRPNPGYEPQHVPPQTLGVPSGRAEWLAVMRAGLKSAVETSKRRHGRVA